MNVERAARNETLFREVNDRIHELSRSNATAEFVCECGQAECIDTFVLGVDTYRSVREYEFRFLVRLEHVAPELEVVREVHDEYLVVEKVGAAAQAVETAATELHGDA